MTVGLFLCSNMEDHICQNWQINVEISKWVNATENVEINVKLSISFKCILRFIHLHINVFPFVYVNFGRDGPPYSNS